MVYQTLLTAKKGTPSSAYFFYFLPALAFSELLCDTAFSQYTVAVKCTTTIAEDYSSPH